MTLSQDVRERLSELAPGGVRFDERMSKHTTLRIGGPVDAWIEPTSLEQLAGVIRFARAEGLPLCAIGAGSNLLVRDGGIRGIALSTEKLRAIDYDSRSVRVESGASTGKLLSTATQRSLGGLEFLGGVPGSIGGGLKMNAGTYLGEFTQVVTAVRSVRFSDGEIVERAHAACGFAYRRSDLPDDEIIVSADLRLTPREQAAIQADVRALRERRKQREPSGVHNSGSTFKNPTGDFAGRLIESVGLKGERRGAAVCSPVHANWLVNEGGATAAELLDLIEYVRARVLDATGITLELEVKVIGVPVM